MVIIASVIFASLVFIGISAHVIFRLRVRAHDMRQLMIYNSIVDRIVKQSIEGDVPRDEALIILNAARDTYNESVLRHKNIQQVQFPEVHLDETNGVDARNETGFEGKKQEGEKPDRTARQDLDSNSQGARRA